MLYIVLHVAPVFGIVPIAHHYTYNYPYCHYIVSTFQSDQYTSMDYLQHKHMNLANNTFRTKDLAQTTSPTLHHTSWRRNRTRTVIQQRLGLFSPFHLFPPPQDKTRN